MFGQYIIIGANVYFILKLCDKFAWDYVSALHVSGHCVSAIKIPWGKVMSEIAEPQPDAPVDGCNHARSNARCCRKSQLLKSLSHPDRLMLLCQLTQGKHCEPAWRKWDWVNKSVATVGDLRKDGLSTPAARANKSIIQSPVRMPWQSSMYCTIAFVRQNN